MRLSFIFLVSLLVLAVFEGPPDNTSGQTSSATTAWNNLIQAFVAVQKADSNGVSHDHIVQLSAELNKAFLYFENASRLVAENNATGADYYAALSTNTASNVSSRAMALENTAQHQLLVKKELSYTTAFAMAVMSAFVVVEFPSIRQFIRRRKVLETKLEVRS